MNRALIAVALTATLAGGYLVWRWAERKPEPIAVRAGACAPLMPVLYDDLPPEYRTGVRPIDVARLPAGTAEVDARVAAADAERRELRMQAGGVAQGASIEVFGWDAMFPYRVSLTARRNSAGDWLVEVLKAEPRRMESPGDLVVTKHWVGIGGEAAARLDRLLAEPCLYSEPAYIPRKAPVVGGGEDECFDGSDTVVVINHAGRTRKAFQECTLRGKTGELVSVLFEALP